MVSASELKDMLTPTQAARRLEVSSQMVNRWMSDGRLPSLVTPLGHLLDPRDVEHLAAKRQQTRAARQ